jgi:hypothetical protein
MIRTSVDRSLTRSRRAIASRTSSDEVLLLDLQAEHQV